MKISVPEVGDVSIYQEDGRTYYLALCPLPHKTTLLAVIVEGYPLADEVAVCAVKVVNIGQIEEWFTETMTLKPWIPRQ